MWWPGASWRSWASRRTSRRTRRSPDERKGVIEMHWRTWIPVVAAGVAAWTTLSAQQPAQQDATQEPAAGVPGGCQLCRGADDRHRRGRQLRRRTDNRRLHRAGGRRAADDHRVRVDRSADRAPVYSDLRRRPGRAGRPCGAPVDGGRLYVLLLDDLHTAVLRTKEVQLEARRFVIENLYDGDIAAVAFTSGRAEGQELTTRRSLLLDALGRFEGLKLRRRAASSWACTWGSSTRRT